MAKSNINVSANVSANPDTVANLLCSENFLTDVYKQREEVVDASFTLKDKKGESIVFRIEETHYKRSKTGSLDKSGTMQHSAEYCYDPKKQILNFDYGTEAKFRITGSYALAPNGAGSKVTFDGNVNVPIPVVGRMIAGMIKKEMGKGFNDIVNGIKKKI
jgi:hypothetical protein